MEWSIQQIAKLAGTTSRTLRHYDDIGLLTPSSVGRNGYRNYDEEALLRLQRILLLRELGLALPQIADVLARPTSEESALEGHLAWLHGERDRLARQIASVESTIQALRGGERLMAENMFDGFDHTQYKDEVEERWGTAAYARSDAWWRGMSDTEKAQWQTRVSRLGSDWIAAADAHAQPRKLRGAERESHGFEAVVAAVGSTPPHANRPGRQVDVVHHDQAVLRGERTVPRAKHSQRLAAQIHEAQRRHDRDRPFRHFRLPRLELVATVERPRIQPVDQALCDREADVVSRSRVARAGIAQPDHDPIGHASCSRGKSRANRVTRALARSALSTSTLTMSCTVTASCSGCRSTMKCSSGVLVNMQAAERRSGPFASGK